MSEWTPTELNSWGSCTRCRASGPAISERGWCVYCHHLDHSFVMPGCSFCEEIRQSRLRGGRQCPDCGDTWAEIDGDKVCNRCHTKRHPRWQVRCDHCDKRTADIPWDKSYLPPRQRQWANFKDGVSTAIGVVVAVALIGLLLWAGLKYSESAEENVQACIDDKMAQNWEDYGPAGMSDHFRDEAEDDCGANR